MLRIKNNFVFSAANQKRKSFDSIEKLLEGKNNKGYAQTNRNRKFEYKINDVNAALEKMLNNKSHPPKNKLYKSDGKINRTKNLNSFYEYLVNKPSNCFGRWYDENDYLDFLSGYNLNKLSKTYRNVSSYSAINQLHATLELEEYDDNLRGRENTDINEERISRLSGETELSRFVRDRTSGGVKQFTSDDGNGEEINSNGILFNKSMKSLKSKNKKLLSGMCISPNELINYDDVLESSGINDASIDLNERISLDKVIDNKLLKSEVNFAKESTYCNIDKEGIDRKINCQASEGSNKDVENNIFYDNKRSVRTSRELLTEINKSKMFKRDIEENGVSKVVNDMYRPKNNNKYLNYPTLYKKSRFALGDLKLFKKSYLPNRKNLTQQYLFRKTEASSEVTEDSKPKRENLKLVLEDTIKRQELRKLPPKNRKTVRKPLVEGYLRSEEQSLRGLNNFLDNINNLSDVLLKNNSKRPRVGINRGFIKRNIQGIKSKSRLENEIERRTEENLQKSSTSIRPIGCVTNNTEANKNRGMTYNSSGYEDAGAWTPPNPNIPTLNTEPSIIFESTKNKCGFCHYIYRDPDPCDKLSKPTDAPNSTCHRAVFSLPCG